MSTVRVALAQINPTVGDLAGNEQKIRDQIARARELQADIVAFPELAVPGYPPEDLLLKPSFVAANLACLKRIAGLTSGITAIVGFVDRTDDLYNAAAVLHEGRVAAVYHKAYLPNYAVFDEDRYFRAGERPLVFSLGEVTVGVNICEDIWYPAGPTKLQALAGAQLVVNISASPYHAAKARTRERMLATRAADNVVYLAFCNLVGGQDELVFDGGSVVFDERGELVARSKQFAEDLLVAELDLAAVFRQQLHDPRWRKERARQAVEAVQRVALMPIDSRPEQAAASPSVVPLLEPAAEIYQALVLGTGDYVRKNGFREVVIGLSGGIDSALTAAIAADALDPENVVGVFMPSRYSSVESREDATQVAENLGIRFLKAPTAELRPNQKDEDSLPPYRVLDPILHAYVEEDRGLEEIIALGFDADTVSEVLRMVDRAEYKRRQAPPGVRITPRAFGRDRRLPITNHYRDAGP